MKKIIPLFFVILCVCTNMTAQETKTMSGKYCLTFEDYSNGRWTEVEEMTLVRRTDSQRMWSGGGDYKFDVSSDKAIEKTIKKKAFAVCMDDALYVNLHNLKHKGVRFGSGYDMAFKTKNGGLVFNETYISKKKAMLSGALAGAGGVFGGAIAGGVIGAAEWAVSLEKRVTYLIDSDTNKVLCLDEIVVPELLEGHADLLEAYSQVDGKQAKRSASVVFPLLIQSGYIIGITDIE